jgi:hypothetical protein
MKLSPIYVVWLLPLILVVVVATTLITNRVNAANKPTSIVVRITDGPTVLSTQVVRIDGR